MSARFDIVRTPIEGLVVLQGKPSGDVRGYLKRLFCEEELGLILRGNHIAQANYTLTEKRSTVRGMHFQLPPHAETKFVSCLHGEVFDVAVDVRQNSPTFLRWHAEILSEKNHKTFIIPEGFAHGFQALTDHCGMLYFHTATYHPGAEHGLNPQDPRLAIQWPQLVSGLSNRDASHAWLDANFKGIAL